MHISATPKVKGLYTLPVRTLERATVNVRISLQKFLNCYGSTYSCPTSPSNLLGYPPARDGYCRSDRREHRPNFNTTIAGTCEMPPKIPSLPLATVRTFVVLRAGSSTDLAQDRAKLGIEWKGSE